MPHRIAPPLISGGGSINRTFTTDTLIGDLWAYLGSPSTARDVVLTVDGADIGNVIITLDWPAGSTFTINCVNGGRVLGLGGDGGNGGSDFGATTESGDNGTDGQPAITSDTFGVSVNVDDGALLGGGGGGGGGAGIDSGSTSIPGGGGGGGQGFSATSGGDAGSGSPSAAPGSDGSQASPGSGGNGGTAGTNDGGDGGIFGVGGQAGRSTDIIGTSGFLNLRGGVGGAAGEAFLGTNGATLTLSGSDDEATLRSLGQIRGETSTTPLNIDKVRSAVAVVSGAVTAGFTFKSNGDLLLLKTVGGGNETVTTQWLNGTGVGLGDDYEIRVRGLTGDTDGTWDASPGADGTWFALSSDRTWSITGSSQEGVGSMIEIRRADDPDGEILGSALIRGFISTTL